MNPPAFDLITIGRLGIDLYPLRTGVPLAEIDTFSRALGGSATNVAIAAARHGLRSALISRTGADAFGDFAHTALRAFGVDDRYVTPVAGLPTPVVFAELFPPEDFRLTYYRYPKAPDLEIRPDELDYDAIRSARILWITATGLCAQPSRSAIEAALEARGDARVTVLDLDDRRGFWSDSSEARRALSTVMPFVSVAVGNQAECELAVGTRDPDEAAAALRAAGVELAVIKMGSNGVLAVRDDECIFVPPHPVEVVNGLGAGDSFGGALCLGLLNGWPLERTLRFANAAGSIVAGRLGCSVAMPDTAEVEAVLEAATRQEPVRRTDRVRG